MAEFTARFYRVTKCGYYPYQVDSDPVMGSLQYLFEELAAWGAGKDLRDTKLPVPTSALPTYLMGVAQRAGCWALVLWNEVPAGEGGVASVVGTSKVGRPVIRENAIAAGTIPGFPTYFLCIPEHDLFVTLKFGDRVIGLAGCKNYLSVFQELCTAAAEVVEDEDGNVRVEGYRDNDGELLSLHPRFRLQLVRSGTQRAKILAQVNRIRKVVRVKEMDATATDDRAMYQKALDYLGLTQRLPPESVKFRQEVEFRPTREEVATIIDQVGDDVEAAVNDIGFVLTGGQTPIWLSGSIPADTLQLDIIEEDGAFDAADMVQILSRRKAHIVAASEP